MTRTRLMLFVFAAVVIIGSWSIPAPVRAQAQGTATLTVPVATVPTNWAPTPPTPGVPALEVHTTPTPAAPAHWPEQALWALIMSYVLQFIKNCKWFPWLTPDTEKSVQAAWGFAIAALTAAGVHLSANGSFFSESGLQITVIGLSFDAVKDVAFQWAAQQGVYDAVVKNNRVV